MTTQTPEQEREDPTAAWRGVKQDIDEERAAGVGLRGPSRRLLVELLRPYKWWLIFLIGVVVVEGDTRVIGFAAKLPKGWELHGQISQEVRDGKKGIRVAGAVVF